MTSSISFPASKAQFRRMVSCQCPSPPPTTYTHAHAHTYTPILGLKRRVFQEFSRTDSTRDRSNNGRGTPKEETYTQLFCYTLSGFAPNVTSWGGNIIRNDAGGFDLWVSEMVGGCGLKNWGTNSRIVHASSPSLVRSERACCKSAKGACVLVGWVADILARNSSNSAHTTSINSILVLLRLFC